MTGRPRSFEPETVLARAMDEFWQHGYASTGLAQLEEATGLGRQSLYGAFGDKRALFAQVIEHYFDSVLKPGLIDVLDAPGSARANLERVFAGWEALSEAPQFRGCLVCKTLLELSHRDAEMAEVLTRKLALMEDAFYRSLRRAKRDGEVSASLDARVTARVFVTSAQGLSVVGSTRHGPDYVSAVIQGLRRLID